MTTELKPCPFCGDDCAELMFDASRKWGRYEATCLEVRTGYDLSKSAPWRDEARAAWNTRQSCEVSDD